MKPTTLESWNRLATCAICAVSAILTCACRTTVDLLPEESSQEPDTPAAGAAGNGAKRVLLVLDDDATTTDERLEERLLKLGFEVTRRGQTGAQAEDAEGFDLLVISPSADRVPLGATFRDAAVPELILETHVAAAMGLGAVAAPSSTDGIRFLDGGSPWAAGFVDPLVLCSGNHLADGTEVLAPGLSLAHVTGAPDASALYLFDAGALVDGEPLAGARLGLTVLRSTGCHTEEAFELFDRAVAWLVP